MNMKIFKNIVFFIIIIFGLNSALTFAANSEQAAIQGKVEFDWIKIEQGARNEIIEKYKHVVLNPEVDLPFQRDEVDLRLKDQNSLETIGKIKSGIEQDDEKIYAGFYVGKLFFAYGIIEKKNPRNAYYYDMMGNLKYVDFLEKDYGQYPYVSNQYSPNGKFIARVYNIGQYDQFMYDENGKFLGRWYQNKLYNQKGKVTLGRSWF